MVGSVATCCSMPAAAAEFQLVIVAPVGTQRARRAPSIRSSFRGT